ncbi:MAG: invasion associated locus B family protein [Pseudomonadota bacterium]
MVWSAVKTALSRRLQARLAAGAVFGALLGAALAGGAAEAQDAAPAWTKECDDNGLCVVQTDSKNQEGVVMGQLVLGRHPERGLVGEIRSPAFVSIPDGIEARVDDSFRFRPTLITCGGRVCVSNFAATDQVVDAMKKGGELAVVFRDARSGQVIGVPFSLIGFTAQFNEL